jgi:hypothetical protein
MSNLREKAHQIIDSLSDKRLEDIYEYLQFIKLKDNQELIGILKTIEPVFQDWVNEEDSIYDSL